MKIKSFLNNNNSTHLFLFESIIALMLIMILEPCEAQYYPYGYYSNNFNGGGFSPYYYNNYYRYGGYNNYWGSWGRAARTRRQDFPGFYCSHAKFCG
ncbi:hypothetical protein Mgra_00008447 [Meloidogyne graminicola]|uniref:Uncharacterized protein n=1 Tax=Meloidogyne graminicola TaxID=189291 RepID=A0A8S9ZFS3_9BILA|nr:hypothetical protein Mgra_00008447 [Meloidogyne graminicola]